jgi:DNA-binding transcriptional LysR family regulator
LVNRLSGISVFVQAATAGNFAKAGDQLGLTRSAVGKSIARLEERLNIRLFQRTPRGQSLTDKGQEFYERCLNVLAELESAEAALDSVDSEPSGILRVSAPVLLGRLCVAPILVAFAQRYPKLELDLRFSDHFVDLVEERIDLAVRIGPLPDRAALVIRTIGSFDMVVCAAPGYLVTRGVPTDLDALAGHDHLPYARRGGRPEPWRFNTPEGTVREIAVSGRIRLDDLAAIVDAAVAGAGIACLPTWLVAEPIAAGRLRPILSGYLPLGNDVYALRVRTPHVATKVRTAIDELASRMPHHFASAVA